MKNPEDVVHGDYPVNWKGVSDKKKRQTTLDEFEGLKECVEDVEKLKKAYREKYGNK